ncbi:MAG: hypothetical protein ACLQVK_03755 [Acidimicrobiales bacterium]
MGRLTAQAPTSCRRRLVALVATSMFALNATCTTTATAAAYGGRVPATTDGHTACTSHSSSAGTLTVCPGAAPAGSSVTIYARGCNGASLVFLGPLDYVGSGGAGELLPRAVREKNGTRYATTFVVPLKYEAGGDLDAAVPVVGGRAYQFGSYPANECSVPFSVTAPSGTRTVIYNPFAASGLRPGLHVNGRAVGTCGESPAPVELRSYYRCFTTAPKKAPGSAFVFDPCFAAPRRAGRRPVEMICPTDPATGDAILLTATSVVPARGDRAGTVPRPAAPTTLVPWAVQLANGQVCQLVDAAWGGLGPYSCQVGPPAGPGSRDGAARTEVADCHLPDSSQPGWTARCQTSATTTSPFRRARLTTVWF